MKVLAAILALALGTAVSLGAQTRQVSGTVVDSGQQPVVGAAVIHSPTNGVTTGVDGTFRLTVPAGPVTLEVNCLGYKVQTVSVPAAQSQVTVVLEEDTEVLNETVVVGYGVQKKVNLTGAVTAVSANDLKDRITHNLTDMLQGSVPGLNISTSSGNPGSVGSLNIRGTTSINGASPLVLVDGAVGELDRVNPNDVESISVIKDASAAAVYGARAAYGVILITTRTGSDRGGKATVRYNGRFGWEEPTTSTDYETRGFWSVYTVDTFWQSDAGKKYTTYTDYDMAQLLARVNDKTEDPSRPWIVQDFRNGRNQWVYYCNTDWWHSMFNDRHPVQTHNVSVSGGDKNIKYYLSGGFDDETGIIKSEPDVFRKFNLRSKIEAKINKYMRISNNTSFYTSNYSFLGVGDVQNAIQYAARHALASFPLQNPDGSWVYGTPMISGSYNVANGRHIMFGDKKDINDRKRNDFSNTTELRINPFKQLTLVANFTYRYHENKNTSRLTNFSFRRYPDSDIEYYTTGAGLDELTETVRGYNYTAGNVFATYQDTFNNAHNLTVTAGYNVERQYTKYIEAVGQNLLSETLNDLSLTGPDALGNVIMTNTGSQSEYALMGFFGRLNYDYKGRYLFEVAGRYDGTSRFAKGHKWGFFPSGSLGWRISEEPFFAPLRKTVSNLKLRASVGTLGNQNVNNYAYLRTINITDFSAYSFGEGSTMAKYATLSAPVASDLTWETTYQYNLGLDAAFLDNRLEFTGEAYIRDTKNMLTEGVKLPAVYGADAPKSNTADLRTKGYELSLSWRDQFNLLGSPFGYRLRATMSDYRSHITKYDNPEKSFAKAYYEGMRIGEVWGFVVDGLFATDEEAQKYQAEVCDCTGYISGRMTGGFRAGDLRYVDLDSDKKLGIGQNTVDNPGDRKILGNSLPSLQYGITAGFDWKGIDFSIFFQGVGNHYWYPAGFNYAFWGPYSYSYASFIPRDFLTKMCWSEENPDAYFPRPRSYSSTGGELSKVNSRYIQNIRYLRLKNLTLGYTLPQSLTKKVGLERVRVYYSGENLNYWSPLTKVTKFLDPESAFSRSSSGSASDHLAYPWQKSNMFGIDITF